MNDDYRLAALGQFTPEGVLTPGYIDGYLFFVGRDDVHGILMHLIGNESLGYKSNEYGFDDPEYNNEVMALFKKPHIAVQITLDSSQAGGSHEKELIEADEKNDETDFSNSFAIGQSGTHQISHTKGRVYQGQGIWCEGSTNLSVGGEGVGVSLKANVKNPVGFKAQNNTLWVSTNPVGLARFSTQLDQEHAIAKAQLAAAKSPPAAPVRVSNEMTVEELTVAHAREAGTYAPGDSITDPDTLKPSELDAETLKLNAPEGTTT